jgi:glycosyltransferase involved in cell wall biosynthesis
VTVSLVTIGIPTYNRPRELERAIDSALAQDHRALELLVSDNASEDQAVRRVCERFASADPRVRIVRQPHNLGHARNYQWLLEAARGEYFMWLADDDWIDPGYVSRCVAALQADRTSALVCGLGRNYQNGVHVTDDRPIDLDSERPEARVIQYFSRVSLNGPLFGLARREDMLAIGFPQSVGGDWMLVAGLAARGRVRTLLDVHVHRSLAGLGADASELARSFGMRGLAARHHHAVIAARVWAQITFGASTFGAMGPITRVGVAVIAAALILVRFTIADGVRWALGPRRAAALEARVSAWLRGRDRAAAP